MAKRHLDIVGMVEEFLCPGCVAGNNTKCGSYKPVAKVEFSGCANHCAGTNLIGAGRLALGLPKGFNRYGLFAGPTKTLRDAIEGHMVIRLWPDGLVREYDAFNVPVWRYEEDGILFVRVFAPRVNASYVDVIQMNNTKANQIAAKAIDAKDFINDID